MVEEQTGFTVVEVVATLIIAVLYITMFFQMYLLIDKVANDSYKLSTTNLTTYAKVAKYENKAFANITTPGGASYTEVEDYSSELLVGLPGTKSGKVYTAQISPTLKAVLVRTIYGETGSNKRTIEYVTYIQQNGLGR